MTKCKAFSKKRKLDAVRLLEQEDKASNDIAAGSGIRRDMLLNHFQVVSFN